jgi:Protein of unknown function (DUF2462)
MTQGVLKSKPSKVTTPSHSFKHGIAKKGARTIAPKNVTLMKQKNMTKKFSAGLTAKTEKMLGAKVGHLELLEGGKKRKGGESTKDKVQNKKG